MKRFFLCSTILAAILLTSLCSSAQSIVYENDFATTSRFAEFTQVDDGNGYCYQSWTYDSNSQSAFINLEDSGYWVFLISPAQNLQADKIYKLTFTARLDANYSEQAVSVYLGTGNALTQIRKKRILYKSLAKTTEAQPVEVEFTPTADGTYYLGFLKASTEDYCGLYIDDIQLSIKNSVSAPSAVSNLSATAGSDGALSATISFTTPATDINGGAISSLEKVELYRGETLIKTFATPSVGAELQYTDSEATAGLTTYTVYAYNEAGKGREASTTVFVGTDTPGAPENAIAKDCGETILISWEAPSTGENGGYVGSNITYTIYNASTGDAIAENLAETSYTYTPKITARQELFAFDIKATNASGEGKTKARTNTIVFGEPYTLPFAESFANTQFTSGPWGMEILNSGGTNMPEWFVREQGLNPMADSEDNDFGVISFRPMSSKDVGFLYSGKITTGNAANPTLQFYTYNNGTDANKIDVMLSLNGGEYQTIQSIDLTTLPTVGWNLVSMPLASYIASATDYISIGFKAYCQTSNLRCVHIDNIRVKNLLQHDLEIADIYSAKSFTTGAKGAIDVTIYNNDDNAESDYTVILYRDGNLEATLPGAALPIDKQTIITFEVTPTNQYAANTTFSASVEMRDDENVENNQSDEIAVVINPAPYPAATALTGTAEGATCKLTWNAPTIGNSLSVTEDFESYKPFITNRIGEWTLIDGDGLATVRPQNDEGQPARFNNVGKPMAYIVFNAKEAGITSENWEAHNGDHSLAAFSCATGNTADWLISPLLADVQQRVTFFARNVSTIYGNESIKFMYSTTDKNPESFTSVAETVVDGRWNEYRYNIPAEAKYFAICHASSDCMAMLLDDITYYPASLDFANMTLIGYNIYRDGEKVNATPVTGTSYNDNPEKGKHTYAITAVYDKGESSYSNMVTIETNQGGISTFRDAAKVFGGKGAIIVNAEIGSHIAIFSADGRDILDTTLSANEIPATPGFYIVTIDGNPYRIIVR